MTYEGGSKNYLLFYQVDGSSVLKEGERQKDFISGRIRVFNPQESFSFLCKEGICVVLEISHSKVLKLMGYQRKLIVCDVDHDENDSARLLRRNIEELIRSYYDAGDNRIILYERCCLQLIFQLISSYSNNVFGSAEDERKIKVANYLEAHYADDISLEDIADEFALTPPYFSKYFKETFGSTFLSYLNKLRLEYAKDDLLKSKESALRIAVNNGFPNSASFIREFRKQYEMTPAQYRQKYSKTGQQADDVNIFSYLQEATDKKTDPVIEVKIDTKEIGEALQPYWTSIINLGSFRTLMKNGMMEQIVGIQSKLHFRSARLLLDTYAQDKRHLFYISDKVMEFFVRNRMDVIAVIDMRNISDKEAYLDFLKEQCQRFVNKFGEGISRHIVFELMYNSTFNDQKLNEYKRFYGAISAVIKEKRIESKVIGPGVLIDHEGENFRRFVKANPEIETYTIFIAPFAIYQKEEELFINRLTDSAYGLEQFETAKRILKEENRQAQILISEWKDNLNEVDALNETAYMGSRVLKNILSGYGIFTSMPLSTPLDLMFDEMKYDKIFDLLPGIVTSSGIEKPSFHALRFLDRQDKHLVSCTKDYLISRSEDEGYYQIVCHNGKDPGYRYFVKENFEDLKEYHEIFEDSENKVFRFVFQDLPKGDYLLKIRRVSDRWGCAYMNYIDLKYRDDSFIGDGEISYLKAAAVAKMEGQMFRVKDDDLVIECTLESNEFCHLHLIRAID